MKTIAVAGLVLALLGGVAVLQAQQPQLPAPQKEHAWLQQLAGEWEAEMEDWLSPGKPTVKGTESARMFGAFWLVTEAKYALPTNPPYATLNTWGYDADKKKYVGTTIDTMTGLLWKLEGTLDTTGKVLTSEAEGPWPATPGKPAKFKGVIELKSKDHKVFTLSVQGAAGKWDTLMIVNARRKK